ncbi:MAG: hypothetical protein HC933_08170 [Pleurocapsa sp. SU_196_0]|nr:hypothetical protein [Pleurocapsa sp. SU_196_0]
MPLDAPDPLTVVAVGDISASLNCAAVPTATGYEFESKNIATAGSFVAYAASATPSTGSGTAVLTPMTLYEFRARAKQVTSNPYRDHILSLNPTHWYEAQTTDLGADSSGNNNDAGWLSSTPAEATGKAFGNAYVPDRIFGSYLTLIDGDTPFTGTGAFTLLMWLRAPSNPGTPGRQPLYYQRSPPPSGFPEGAAQALSIAVAAVSGDLEFVSTVDAFTADPILITPTAIWDNAWHAVFFRRDALGEFSINIDGVEIASLAGALVDLQVRKTAFFYNPRDGGFASGLKAASLAAFSSYFSDADCLTAYTTGIVNV